MSQSDFVSRARELIAAGQCPEAVKVCRLGLLGRPNSVDGRLLLGRALLALGRPDEVLAEMRAALEIDGSSIGAYLLRGEALMNKQDAEGAAIAYRAAVQMAPGDRAIAEMLHRAEAAMRGGARGAVISRGGAQFENEDSLVGTVEFQREHLAPLPSNKRSATVEVDPEMEGVMVEDDAIAAPPKPAPGHAPIVAHGVRLPESVVVAATENTQSLALIDLEEMGKAHEASLAQQLASQPTVQHGHARALGPSAATHIHQVPQQVMAAAASGGAPPAAALPQAPQPQRVPAVAANFPTMALSASQAQSAQVVQNLFASEPPASASSNNAVALRIAPPGRLEGDLPTDTRPAQARPRRRRLVYALWTFAAVIVIGGGVFAGLRLRDLRLEKQVNAAFGKADKAALDDGWRSHQAGRDILLAVNRAKSDRRAQHRISAVNALLAYEFGDGADAAVAQIGALNGTTPHLLVARGYVALLNADIAQAERLGRTLFAQAGFEAVGHYFVGRARLLLGDSAGALEHLRISVEREPRPAYQIALAEANVGQGLIVEAEALFASTQRSGQSAAATVLRVVADRMAATPGTRPELAGQLDTITIAADKPLNDASRTVSPLWGALALLAAAESQALSGDVGRAKSAFDRAVAVAVDDYRYVERTIYAQLAMGNSDGAATAAEKAVARWPQHVGLAVARAQVALARANPTAALAAVAQSGNVSAAVLTIRGSAALANGDLQGARSALDAALLVAPARSDALAARALVDIFAGDAARALQRLGTVDTSARPELAVVYGLALRRSGESDTALPYLARGQLATGQLYQGLAVLESGRLARERGDVVAARDAFAKAAKLGMASAGFELAVVDIDDRELDRGKAALEAQLAQLVAAGRSPTGDLLLELTRARTLAGEVTQAEESLRQAEKIEAVAKWLVLRERGRLAIRKGDIPAASAALAKAMEDKNSDAETLLLVANVVENDANQAALATTLRNIAATRLANTGELHLVIGKLELAAGRSGNAELEFAKAKETLQKQNGLPRRRAVAHLGLAAIAFEKRDDARARAEVTAAVELDPASPEAHLFAAELATTGAARIGYLARAVQLAPNHVTAWILFGQAAQAANDTVKLNKAIERLSELAPNSPELNALKAPVAGPKRGGKRRR